MASIVFNQVIPAGSDSGDQYVTPCALIGVSATRPVQIYDVNTASGSEELLPLLPEPRAGSFPIISVTGVIKIYAVKEDAPVIISA